MLCQRRDPPTRKSKKKTVKISKSQAETSWKRDMAADDELKCALIAFKEKFKLKSLGSVIIKLQELEHEVTIRQIKGLMNALDVNNALRKKWIISNESLCAYYEFVTCRGGRYLMSIGF